MMKPLPWILLVLFTWGAAALAAPGDNLLSNGDFEAATRTPDWPDHWPRPDGASYETEQGNHFLRLRPAQPDAILTVYRAIDLKPDQKALSLNFRARAINLVPGKANWHDGRIIIDFKNAEGKKVGRGASPNFKGSTDGWVQRDIQLLVPPDAVKLEIMPALFYVTSGTLDVDDLELRAIDAAPLLASQAKAQAEQLEKDTAQERKVEQKLTRLLSETGNLVENGQFAPNAKNDGVQGWGQKKEDGSILWQQEAGTSTHFMRLTTVEPNQLVMLYRVVPLPEATQAIRVSVRYRTSGVEKGAKMPGDARLIGHFLSGPRFGRLENGEKVTPGPSPIGFGASTPQWTDASAQFLVPPGATKLQLMPGLWFAKAGVLDIAELKVTPLTDAEAQAMAHKAAAAQVTKNAEEAAINQDLQGPPRATELRVRGNQIMTTDNQPVWLQGVNVDSMQWGMGEHILRSIRVAIDQWHANVIRLPINEHFWYGKQNYQNGNPQPYRTLVDQAVQLCAAKGVHIVLDLHRFRAPTQEHVDFWNDVATRYKNNPAVLFELFNEPHDITWEVWKNGGIVTDKPKAGADVVAENTEALRQFKTTGMQALIDVVRQTGARNIVIVGGLDWSYDLSGILNGYALDDRGGNGIVYSTHIYPWKSGWRKHFLDVADQYPLFIGEIGTPEKWEDFAFIPQSQRKEKLGPQSTWAKDALGMIQSHRLNWTGFSFHPKSGPPMLKDWSYAPTEFWGAFVKKALAGQLFEMEKMR